MSPNPSSKNLTVARRDVRPNAGQPCRACDLPSVVGVDGHRSLGDTPVPAQASVSSATAYAGCVTAIGCIVGACGTARKPLASLGLGLAAALRVHSVPPLAQVAALSDTQPAPSSGARRTL